MNKTIGFIGLGKMGARMSKRLIQAGFSVVVYDICHTKMDDMQLAGARTATTIQELIENAEVIITMLPQPADTKKVFIGRTGIIKDLEEGKIIIDMSTSSLSLTLKIYQEAESHNIKMLDAPVSGGLNGAEEGTLTIMIGGPKKVFEECKTIFEAIGTNICFTGKAGNGVTMKLLNNLVYSVNMCALSEVLVLGESLGLEVEQMLTAFKNSSGGSYCVENKAKNYILANNFSPGFSTDNLLKDISLAMELAEKHSQKPAFCGLAQKYFKIAHAQGLGGEDNSSIIKIFRN